MTLLEGKVRTIGSKTALFLFDAGEDPTYVLADDLDEALGAYRRQFGEDPISFDTDDVYFFDDDGTEIIVGS